MTKPTAWMPFYVGDYLRDTAHLTTHQHGAYLLLIMHYWSSGHALPDDDLQLQNICHVPADLWPVVKTTISAFFKIENGRWHHERIERELSAAFDRKDAAVRRGKASAAARWGGKPSINQAIVKHSNHSHKDKNHESVTTDSTDAARDPALNGGSGPRASRTETSKERLARLAEAHRQKTLRQGEP